MPRRTRLLASTIKEHHNIRTHENLELFDLFCVIKMSELDDFEIQLRRHGPAIYTLAMRLCGNTSDAEDIAQETFLRAFEKRDQFRGDAAVLSWLYRICVNTWKNRVRYEKSRSFWKHFSLGSRHSDDEEEGVEFDLPSPDPSIEETLQTSDEVGQLQEALQKLQPEERGIIVLREMQNLSYEEIAEQLDIPIGTVRSRLARIREKLRRLITEKT